MPYLEQLVGDSPDQMLIAGLAFAAAALAVAGVGSLLGGILRRHPEIGQAYERNREQEGLQTALWRMLVDIGEKIAASPRLEATRRKVRINLVKAGRPPEETAETYLGEGFAFGVVLGLGLSLMSLVTFGGPNLILSFGAVTAYGLVVHPARLQSEADARVRQVSRRLPFAIDLAVLVLEAGGTLSEALNILAESGGEDPVAEEIRLVLEGQKAGRTQARALQDFATRMELEDLNTLVLAINRGEEMGAAMKDTLRTQSEVIRERRFERAEKIAAEAPVKMMLPNMIIMMATLLVIMGPMLIKIVKGDF